VLLHNQHKRDSVVKLVNLTNSMEQSRHSEAKCPELVKKFPHFMKPGSSMTHSQVTANFPYPEPNQFSPCPPFHFLKIHFSVILPYTPSSSKWSLYLSFPGQNSLWNAPLSSMCHKPRLFHYCRYDHPNNIW